MARELKVFWTENSIQDLFAIKEFISSDSPERAEAWIRKLYLSGEDLANLPLRGRIVPEFNDESIREILVENYRLVYRLKTTCVEILTVFEGHRQLKRKIIKG